MKQRAELGSDGLSPLQIKANGPFYSLWGPLHMAGDASTGGMFSG